MTNIHHSVDLSWSTQSGVASYTVQYTQTQGASQLGECKNSTHSGSVSTTSASTSITVQGSGDGMVKAFTTYSITVTAVSATSALGSSAPSSAVLVTTAQTGLTRIGCILEYLSKYIVCNTAMRVHIQYTKHVAHITIFI